MPAVEGDRNRPAVQNIRQSDQMPLLIRQKKRRHRVPRLRRSSSGVTLLQPRYQPIHRLGKRRAQLTNSVSQCLQTLAQ